ncbi:hypothetical protein [Deinococcus navajonensis]|uniref:Uncharacterized protein n=1 Tax=Deinococcus navajonensis TaxID=309884 RepID=A0ABV8XU96_9DEIO
MLTVTLHLTGGDVITLDMTPTQKDRLNRTVNQVRLPVEPLTLQVHGTTVDIPWRSIAYVSSLPQVQAESMALEAAD